jgi:glutathione S-transferase
VAELIYPGIVSCIALLIYYYTLLMSGLARGRFDVAAPSHDGPEEYQRYVRAHQNTLEHLVLFLPGLWLFVVAVDPIWASAIGIMWPIGRLMYARGYYQEAAKRQVGLVISMLPIYVLILGSLAGFLYAAFS